MLIWACLKWLISAIKILNLIDLRLNEGLKENIKVYWDNIKSMGFNILMPNFGHFKHAKINI